MPKYGQYCPVAQALDILGDRWTLLIIRDMLTGTQHFNDMERGLPGISRGLLSRRLNHLQQVGIIEKYRTDNGRNTTEYHLTESGKDLHDVINSLMGWGAKWSFGDPTPEELDPLLMVWWMRGRVNQKQIPDERIVIQIDFYGHTSETYWLLITTDDVAVCMTDPGFEINILLTADLFTFFKLWLGQISYNDARKSSHITVEGMPYLIRNFPNWFLWSPAAPVISRLISA